MDWLLGVLVAASGVLGSLFFVVVMLLVALASVAATMLPVALVLFLLPGMLEEARKRTAQRRQTWSEVAAELGGSLDHDEIRGVVDGRALRVATRVVSSGNNSSQTYTDVSVAGVHPGLALEAQHFLSNFFGGTDHQVGDKALDDALVVGGSEVALGLLDAETRKLLRDCPYRVRVRDGALRLTASGAVGDGAALRDQVHWARRLAAALCEPPEGMAARLTRGVVEDPEAGVRRRFLELLRDRFPDQAAAVAERALEDADRGVHAVAAAVLGRGDLLLALIADAQAPESTRLRAIEALPVGAVEEGIRIAVAAPGAGRMWRAAALVAPTGGSPAVAAALSGLQPVLEPAAWPASGAARGLRTVVAREVAKALGQLPAEPSAEALLCTLLRVDDAAAREAAIEALEAVGTVSSVPELNAVVEGGGILSGLGGKARRAVRAIQARAGGERGAVALAAASGGGLTMAVADQESAVAEADEERRRKGRAAESRQLQ